MGHPWAKEVVGTGGSFSTAEAHATGRESDYCEGLAGKRVVLRVLILYHQDVIRLQWLYSGVRENVVLQKHLIGL